VTPHQETNSTKLLLDGKLVVAQVVNKSLFVHGTQWITIMFTRIYDCTLSWTI